MCPSCPPNISSTSSRDLPLVSCNVAAANSDPARLTPARIANETPSPRVATSGPYIYEHAAPDDNPTKLQMDAAILRTGCGNSSALRILGTQPQPNE